MTAARRFTLDRSYRRPGGGRLVIAGSPLRLFTPQRGGRTGARRHRARRRTCPPRHERLTDRLVDAGALHPVLDPPADRTRPARLTVVVPAHGELPLFRPLARAAPSWSTMRATRRCTRCTGARGACGSTATSARAAPATPVSTLVDTEFVAFVDTDVEIDEGQLIAAARRHFDDPESRSSRRASVADRSDRTAGRLRAVGTRRSTSAPRPARIAPTTRVSFVPAAVDRVSHRSHSRGRRLRHLAALRRGRRPGLATGRGRVTAAATNRRSSPAIGSAATLGCVAAAAMPATARRQRRWPSAIPAPLAPFRMSGWSAASWAAARRWTSRRPA